MSQKAKVMPSATLVVMLLYALIAVVMTYPVAFKLSSAVAGGATGDNFQWAWFLWWGKKAWLDLGTSVANLETLYYPTGAYHPLLAAEPYVQLLALPLVSLFGPRVAYNVEFLLSFLLSGLTMYLLCAYITRNRCAAFIGGLVFGFFPSRATHAVAGHFGQIMTYWLPLYALFLFKLFAKPSVRITLLCGLFLTLSLTVYLMHIAYFVLPFTLLFLIIYRQGLLNARFIKGFVGALFLAAFLSAPFLFPIVAGKLSGQTEYLGGKSGMTDFSVDLLAFLIPPPYHPLLSLWEKVHLIRHIVYAESMAYLGLIALCLALWGVKRKKSEARFWLILGVSAAVLSLGPFLKIGGELVRCTVEGKESHIVLPYALLTKVPFLEWGRTPGRLSGTMSFALAVLAGLGAGDILPRLKKRARGAFVGVTALLVLFEYVAFSPFPMAGEYIPDFYRKIAEEPEEYAILDLPIETGGSTGTSNRAMYYQMFHEHKIVGGFIHRFPLGAKELTRLIGQLVYRSLDEDIVAYPSSEEGLTTLSRLGVRYVVAHKSSSRAAEVVASLQQSLDRSLFEDKQITVFATPQENDKLPVKAIPFLDEEDNWRPLESWDSVPSRWMSNDGLIYFYLPEEGKYRLRFTAFRNDNHPANLQVFVNEQLVEEFAVEGWQFLVTPAQELEKGLNVVRFHLPKYSASNQESEDQARARNMLFQEVDMLLVALPSTWSPNALDIEQHLEANLGDGVRLLGYNIKGSLRPGGNLHLTLFWRALSRMDHDYTVFTHFVDGEGRKWGQKDNPPVDGFYPTSQWEEGDIVRDQYNLVISPDAPPGEYWIEVGMYLPETGERLEVRGEEGLLPENRILLSPPVIIR